MESGFGRVNSEPSNRANRAQPFQGCESSTPQSQGSLGPSRTGQHSATLGFEAESLWDSAFEKVHGFKSYTNFGEFSRHRMGALELVSSLPDNSIAAIWNLLPAKAGTPYAGAIFLFGHAVLQS